MTKTQAEDVPAGIEFLAPGEAPPEGAGSRAHYTRWSDIRDQLATQPNVWAIVLEAKEGEPGYNSVHGKRKALLRDADGYESEIRTENGVRRLYARFTA